VPPVKCGCLIVGPADRSRTRCHSLPFTKTRHPWPGQDVQRLVAQLGEFSAPAGASSHGLIVEDRADDVDFLPVVDLVHTSAGFANRRAVGVVPAHEPRYVFELTSPDWSSS